ncbi:MAG: pilus assembly protein PilP [Rhodocyclaceae bacterium]|nr:pilus assembly protein PilP [Rhodocyclaceae bacterium]
MKRLTLLAFCFSLAACSGGEHEDLQRWMDENSKDLRPNIAKLPEVKPYEAVPYDPQGLVDPFKSSKIEPETKNKAGKGGEFQPDMEAREMRNSILEKYPLESLKMIGYLNINNQPIAAIQVEDKVKQAKVGEYLGLDFGMVTQITDTEVKLRELIQDSAGDWSERESSLYLQGKEGSKK